MGRKRLPYPILLGLLWVCVACDLNPPVHATFNISVSQELQAQGVMITTQRFAFHLGMFNQECDTSAACQIQDLSSCDLSDNANATSCSVSVVIPNKGEQDIWIEALGQENAVLARAYMRVKFLHKRTTVSAVLGAQCAQSAECDDDVPCNGSERCEMHVCHSGEDPADGLACFLPGPDSGHCVGGECVEAACGDGFVCIDPLCSTGPGDGVEECDDGNDTNNDACSNACSLPKCGDHITQSNEECDDGNHANDDTCLSGGAITPNDANDNCVLATCGDGYACSQEGCAADAGGPGIEICDDGGDSVTCDADCTDVVCGDGHQNSIAGEACDDGNNLNDDVCLSGGATTEDDASDDCIVARCGDGYACMDNTCFTSVGGPGVEICDDGNTANNDACLSAASTEDGANDYCVPARCGDGYIGDAIDPDAEECDDGNGEHGDGCGADCQQEDTWFCGGEPSSCSQSCGNGDYQVELGEECDEGSGNTNDCLYGETECSVCNLFCQEEAGIVSFCGDGELDSANGEVCDDGNTDDCVGDCTGDCSKVITGCGDGYVCAEEVCDDNNTTNGDGCSSNCDYIFWQQSLPDAAAGLLSVQMGMLAWRGDFGAAVVGTATTSGKVYGLRQSDGDLVLTYPENGDAMLSSEVVDLAYVNPEESFNYLDDERIFALEKNGKLHAIDIYGRCADVYCFEGICNATYTNRCIHDDECDPGYTCLPPRRCENDWSRKCWGVSSCGADECREDKGRTWCATDNQGSVCFDNEDNQVDAAHSGEFKAMAVSQSIAVMSDDGTVYNRAMDTGSAQGFTYHTVEDDGAYCDNQVCTELSPGDLGGGESVNCAADGLDCRVSRLNSYFVLNPYADASMGANVFAPWDDKLLLVTTTYGDHAMRTLNLSNTNDALSGGLAVAGGSISRTIGITTQGYLVQAGYRICPYAGLDECEASFSWDWPTNASAAQIPLNGGSVGSTPAVLWVSDPLEATEKGPGLLRIYFGDTEGIFYRYESSPYRYCSGNSTYCLEDEDCGSQTCSDALPNNPNLVQSLTLTGSINATPAIDSLENIYVALNIDEPANTGRVCKLSYPGGDPLTEDLGIAWCQDLAAPPSGGVLLDGGHAFVATTDGKIYAFEALAGEAEALALSSGAWGQSGATSSSASCVDEDTRLPNN